MKFIQSNKRAILASLLSFIVGSSIVAECSNGGKIRVDIPAAPATS